MSVEAEKALVDSRILSLRPDDIVLVTVKDKTKQESEELGLAIKKLVHNKVLVVPENVRIEIIPSESELIVAGVTK
jgi:SepF-like predicted cell division protein (DUF552 family)